jgi:hypothetical protein
MAELYRRSHDLEGEWLPIVRSGKGSHEIWFSPISERHVTVPRSTKSRHTANEVLKEAGLAKSF